MLVALLLFVLHEIATYGFAGAYGYLVLGRSLGPRSFCNWDCGWYATIFMYGYDAFPSRHAAGDAANWAFFPLFPALAAFWYHVAGLRFEDALLLTGTLALPIGIYLFIEFVERENVGVGPWMAGSLIAFNPYGVYAHTGYSEPVYFALCAGALVALQRGRWLIAGLLGAACSATRLVGIFLTIPMLARWLGRARRVQGSAEWAGRLDPPLAIALVPLGLALFGWTLYWRTGDMLGFVHIQRAWGRTFQNPLLVWWQAYADGGWLRFFAVQAALALLAAVYLCARRRIGYGVYLAAMVVAPLCSSVWSIPRYIVWQPVLLLALAMLARRRAVALVLLPVFWAGFFLMIVAWFSGQNFVN
jgi:hypothetical protein